MKEDQIKQAFTKENLEPVFHECNKNSILADLGKKQYLMEKDFFRSRYNIEVSKLGGKRVYSKFTVYSIERAISGLIEEMKYWRDNEK